ncbi:MAG: hypothetical protein DWI57_02755 [Chloroflexi bacterium]|nr:MAG: hypothetical protein DWI57_02755 [Chloroflexota bacterium]
MPSILEALPTQGQKDELLGSFGAAITPEALGLDKLQRLDVAGLAASFPVGDIQSFQLGSLPPLPAGLSRNGVLQQLQQPLDRLKSINAAFLLEELGSFALTALPTPTFPIVDAVGEITGVILPTIEIAPPSLALDPLGQELLDISGINEPLHQLAQAGAATPFRLLRIIFGMLDSVAATVTDTDKLVKFTTQSLQEVYLQQIESLDARLPLVALESAIERCGVSDEAESFAAQYKLLLDEIEILGEPQGDRVRKLTAEATRSLLPVLRGLDESRLTLELLKANDVEPLRQALDGALDLTSSDAIFLQKYFDIFGERVGQVLESVAGPVTQIRDMAQQVQTFLESNVATAEASAQSFAQQITATLQQVEQWVQAIEAQVRAIQAMIEGFVAKLDITALIERAKMGCVKIGEGVDLFFTKIEELKQQLDAVVANLATQVDETVTAAFQELETRIRELLAQITALLYREDVQRALKQARDGIEKFKNAIDQASIKPVFDLVIHKTDEMESSIKSLNVARLGLPQRTALQVGAKVISEVKIDEIVTPELMEAFEEIRAPLAALIELLKEKVLLLEQEIERFNPGSLATELLVNSGPYQLLMQALDSFRPSQLLTPLKDLNGKVVEIVQALDPNRLIDEVQALYDQLASLLEIINPAPLNRLISDATATATTQLVKIRDEELERILQTVQEAISLEKLMARTGMAEIAEAAFWEMLIKLLNGGYLALLKKAMDQAEEKLSHRSGSLQDNRSTLRLQSTLTNIERQLIVDGALIGKRIGELQTLLQTEEYAALQARRERLLVYYADASEVSRLLGDLDLSPLLQLQVAVEAAAKLTKPKLNTAMAAIATELQAQQPSLQAMDANALKSVGAAIFRKQIGDPVRQLATLLEEKFLPYQETVTAITGIVELVLALPARIDAIVGGVLTTTKESVASLITQIVSALETFSSALTGTLQAVYAQIKQNVDKLSPAWMLNSFAESDFVRGGSPTQPDGLLRMAARIVNGADEGGVRLAALLQTQLSEDEFAVLQTGVEGLKQSPAGGLAAGASANVYKALNLALVDKKLLEADYLEAIKNQMDGQMDALEEQIGAAANDESVSVEQRIDLLKQFYRLGALQKQIAGAEANYRRSKRQQELLRLNRVLLEAYYPADVAMSLQSLHPYAVEQIAHLYPEQTVQRLDDIYGGVLDKVKMLPDQLLRAPLDEAFNEIKQVFKENFDIAGIFDVLDIKLDDMEEDLSSGLDRLSDAYNRLLLTFDQRLAVTA